MSVGKIPAEWSRTIVTPVYKGGLSSDVSNYRPISLTCVACKLMERIIVHDMLFYLLSHKLISKQQHGFLCRKSTTTNILETLNDWSLALNQRKGVAAAYIDYAKAFDTVCHDKLCHKLAAYGIAGTFSFHFIYSIINISIKV